MSVSFGTVGGPTPAPAVGVVGGTIWRIVNFLRGDGRWARPWPPAPWRAKAPCEDGVSIASIAIAMETNVCISVYGRSCCMSEFSHFQPFFAISPAFWTLQSPSAVCVCPWHTMWHLGGLWGCRWEPKAPHSRHWAITGRHVARAHLYVEMPASRLDMGLCTSPSIP